MAEKFSSHLKERLSATRLAEVEARAGIPVAVASRARRNVGEPSFETVFRFAWLLGEDLAEMAEMAGKHDLARMARQMLPAKGKAEPSPKAAELRRRLERLLNRGQAQRLEEALERIEATWEVLRPLFERLAASLGAKAAVLAAYRQGRDPDVYFLWRCSAPLAEAMAEKEGLPGWQAFSRSEQGFRLALYLKEPKKADRRRVEETLDSWSAGILTFSG